jgi:radial spoke head protein 4A
MASTSAAFDEAKAYLQSKGAGGDDDMFAHLSETLLKLVVQQPTDAYNIFENISCEAKADAVQKKADFVTSSNELKARPSSVAKDGRAAYSDQAGKLFAVPGEDDEAPPEPDGSGQDIVEDATVLEWAGVSLGREDNYRLQLSLDKLATIEKAPTSLRIWGKICGTRGDYFVAEGIVDGAEPEGEIDEKTFEMPGQDGCNKYTYWASSFPGAEWTELPNVTMAQIAASRKIKKYFTGDLNATVACYPPFPGTEQNLLRAQITRIANSTILVPDGLFADNGDVAGQQFEPAEEPVAPSLKELCDWDRTPPAWQHFRLYINPVGRCTEMPRGEDEDEDSPTAAGAEVKPCLCHINKDDNAESTWRIRQNGGCAVVSSMSWPGAHTVGRVAGKKVAYCSIYVGYGTKHSDGVFTPQAPPQLQPEFEPTPAHQAYPNWEAQEMEDVKEDPTPEGEEGEED